MKHKITGLLIVVALISGVKPALAQGQGLHKGWVMVPDSSLEHPEDVGKKAHTNHVIFLRQGATYTAPWGETPASIRDVYGLPATGGAGVIAIVDAFDYPTAQADFDTFSGQFSLHLSSDKVCNGANPCFQKVYAAGKKPKANCGWAQEAALDIQWAHAMAPYAQIVLVEAASNGFSDLFQAVEVATNIVLTGGVQSGLSSGEVSMSWGGSEFSTEATNDGRFTANDVVYFAASGDAGGKTIYPGVSPNVVSAGGTTINRDASGHFVSETGWSGSGGGPSKYEPRPSYQDKIITIVGSRRGAPDFSFDANPNSGVSVYDSTPCQGSSGWLVFGGTSVSSPSLAGIVNLAGHFYLNTGPELSTIYADYASPTHYPRDFRDITSGTAGSYSAKLGWDFVTGVGSNKGLNGK
ncbi:MAG: S53 family peptidase [Terriglobia bacterium]